MSFKNEKKKKLFLANCFDLDCSSKKNVFNVFLKKKKKTKKANVIFKQRMDPLKEQTSFWCEAV